MLTKPERESIIQELRGYNGNPNLLLAGEKYQYTKWEIEEILKCKNDIHYFIENYVKIVHVDRGLIPFIPWDYQNKTIDTIANNRFVICKFPRQTGKALPLTEDILTEKGFIKFGDLQVGDKVYGRDGHLTTVNFVTETMYNHDCYEIEFDDKNKIVADKEHLWNVSCADWENKEKTLTTEKIIQYLEKKKRNGQGLYINNTKPLQFSEKNNLTIDPYLLGLWLGDGNSGDGRITSHINDFEEYKKILPNISNHVVDKRNPNIVRFSTTDTFKNLRLMNLLKNKHVPDVYKFSSVDQRLELIRGVMDSDGWISKSGNQMYFYNKNKTLIDDFVFILNTLGIKTRITEKYINDKVYYNVFFMTKIFNIFHLPRKLKRQNTNNNNKLNERLYIRNIKKVTSVPVRCIQVDNKDHMFLVGKRLTPTHNSTTVVAYILWYILFNQNVRVGILAHRAQTARDLFGKVRLAYEHLPKFLQAGIAPGGWNKGSIILGNGSIVKADATTGGSIRGEAFNMILLDEFAFVENNIAQEFMESVYPTISSGTSTKLVVVSCVVKDTFVFSDTGLRQISDFIDENQKINPHIGYETKPYVINGFNRLNSGNVMVNSGISDTFKITSQSSNIECSLNHKLWSCINGKYDWNEAYKLKVGDFIAINYNQNLWGNNDQIMFDTQTHSPKEHNIFNAPSHINEDIAYFLGLFLAEGYARKIYTKNQTIRGGQIVITCGDDISFILNKMNIKWYCYDGIHYNINSLSLLNFIENIGFNITNKAKEKIIPKNILSWSKKNISSFLSGFFDGDGTILLNKKRISVRSSSKTLIEQIRMLLMNFGILTTYSTGVTPPTKKVKVASNFYSLSINLNNSLKFIDEIGFRLPRKQQRQNQYKASKRKYADRSDVIPYTRNVVSNISLNGVHKKTMHFNRKRCLDQYGSYENIINENLKWEKITAKIKSQNEVFDFSLNNYNNDEWNHSVLYNGIVGHQTPKGMNHFYEMWEAAIQGKSEFVPIEVKWNEVPGRDEEWKKKQIANITLQSWLQEFEGEFLGSTTTLLSTESLQKLMDNIKEPITINNNTFVYEESVAGRQYALCVDVSRGQGLDYQALSVIDVTNFPYRQVLTFRDNKLSPTVFPTVIKTIAEKYNDAHILVEISDVGGQVADMLVGDLDTENVIRVRAVPGKGQFIGFGTGGKVYNGLKTSPATKRIGCADLKTLIENNKLEVPDRQTVKEFTTFVVDSQSFAAEEGKNDDLVMTLVLFGWLSHQRYFRQETQDIRQHLEEENQKYIESQMIPFGIIDDGISSLHVDYA